MLISFKDVTLLVSASLSVLQSVEELSPALYLLSFSIKKKQFVWEWALHDLAHFHVIQATFLFFLTVCKIYDKKMFILGK